MRVSLLHTPRIQASIALVGVMIIACTAVLNTYLGMREHRRDRAIIALVAHQRQLAHTLLADATSITAEARRGQLAAGEATFRLLLTLADSAARSERISDPFLTAIDQTWMQFTHATSAQSLRERQVQYHILARRLEALAARHERRLALAVHNEAGRQVIILACAAPLLAWAFVAISRTAVPSMPGEPLSLPPSNQAARLRSRFEWHDPIRPATTQQRTQPELHLTSSRNAGAPDLARELHAHAADFRQMTGITVELALDERAAAAVPPSARMQALTIAREAIADTRRDEQATTISIAIWQDAGSVWLAVTDDGIRDPHPGLAITHARAERIGGELRISTQAEGGVCLIARLPSGETSEPQSVPSVRAPRRAW